MRKIIFGLFLLSSITFISGCETAKTATVGMGEAMVKDVGGVFDALQKADDWLKENYW